MNMLFRLIPFGAIGREQEGIWAVTLDQWVRRADIVVNGVPFGRREN